MTARDDLTYRITRHCSSETAETLLDAYRFEVLAEAATAEAYDGELAMYRQLVRTLRMVVRSHPVDVGEVRRLLHHHAADDAAARAELKGEISRTGDATLDDAGRQAALLDAIRKDPGKHWKSGRALQVLQDLGYAYARRKTAALDLARLADAGHLVRHDEKGVTYYLLARRGDGRA